MNRFGELLLALFSWCCTLLLTATVGILMLFLLRRGLPAFDAALFFGDTPPLAALLLSKPVFDGLFPALFGTLALVLLAIACAVPVGLAAGIYLAEYAAPAPKRLLNLFFDVLAGIPSIVIGLAGFALAIVLHRTFSGRIGHCLLLSALSLAFLVLPYLIRSTQNALEAIDPVTRRTALALGASKLQNILYVLLPNRLADLTGGVILAVGRCAEDTAVIMLTGVVASAGIPNSLLRQYEALPFYIYYISSQYSGPEELQRGFAAALVLLSLCVALFLLAFFIQRRLKERLLYR
ncbi:MAG: ABC transporter permease subunit [Desulfuromonadaceae bacterium]|nr:ABC transporter permease subunit [Desulfuromonadaceae bacterium]